MRRDEVSNKGVQGRWLPQAGRAANIKKLMIKVDKMEGYEVNENKKTTDFN